MAAFSGHGKSSSHQWDPQPKDSGPTRHLLNSKDPTLPPIFVI